MTFAYIAMATAASAATTDLRERRIPNLLVFPVMLIALLGHLFHNGLDGLLFFGLGWGAGLLVFLLPFALGAMGAGDVKLMAAIGALMGWRFILVTALYASVAGFFVAIVILAFKRGWLLRIAKYLPEKIGRPLLAKLGKYTEADNGNGEASAGSKKRKTMVPYGLCIAIGVFFVLVGQQYNNWPLINFIQ